MFLAEIRKIMYTPVNPSFRFKGGGGGGGGGSKLYWYVFVMPKIGSIVDIYYLFSVLI